MSDIVIHRQKTADLPEILNFVKQNMGTTGYVPRTSEYWRWKHVSNPFGPSPCLTAESGDEIIGLRTFLRWKWKAGDLGIPAVRAVDTGTHPRWRRRGIFSLLTRKLLEEMKDEGSTAFVFNTPNPSSRAGYLTMGWLDICRIPVFIKPLRPLRMIRRVLKRGNNAPEISEKVLFKNVSEFLNEPDSDLFLRNLHNNENRLFTVKDRTYLNWRYCNIPKIRYYAAYKIQGDSGAVVIFRRRVRKKMVELTIAEILATDDKPGITSAVRLIREISKVENADYIAVCASKETPELKAIRLSGFIPFPFLGPYFTVFPLTLLKSIDPSNWNGWRISLGDMELF